MERRLFGKTLFKRLREEFQTDITIDYFNLSSGNWYSRTQFIKQMPVLYQPYVINRLDHIRGIRTLFRNISFLALICFPMSLILLWRETSIQQILVPVRLFLSFTVPIVISSLLGFHYTSHVLFATYILVLKVGRPRASDEDFKQDVIAALSGDVIQKH